MQSGIHTKSEELNSSSLFPTQNPLPSLLLRDLLLRLFLRCHVTASLWEKVCKEYIQCVVVM